MTFEDVISQPHITRTLKNQLKTSHSTHAYLFTGSRGTGKTTCAKILAKAINCTDLKDGNPCLECDSCRQIENGTPDIVEIDAASNNGVDDVRALRDEIVYSPVSCKYRVYIIDEVHMLSASAFNALLKTIEEPPPHVVFILATTESHKVPATIISRCQRFEFRRINIEESAELLLKIASNENIPLDKDAAILISRLSDGGMRDALNLLDTCAATTKQNQESPESHITVEIVSNCAGIAGKEHLFAISEAVMNQNSGEALMMLDSLHNRSKDMGRLIDELIYHYRNLMLLKIMPNASLSKQGSGIFTLLPRDWDEYKNLCSKISLEHIMRTLHILEECFEKLGRSGNRRLLVEMCLIGLCEPRLDINEKALSARIGILEEQIAALKTNKTNQTSQAENSQKTKTETLKEKHNADLIPPLFPNESTELVKNEIPDEPIMQNEPMYDEPEIYYTQEVPDFNNVHDIPYTEDFLNIPDNQNYQDSQYIPDVYDVPYVNDTIDSLNLNANSVNNSKPVNNNQYLGWGDALNLLPPFLSGILENADVSLNDEVLTIRGNELMKGIMSNPENNTFVLNAVNKISNGKVSKLEFIEIKNNTERKDETSRVEAFINMLKAEGVELKIK